jgi:hypothetical protein
LFNPPNNYDYSKWDVAATELNGNPRNGTITFANVTHTCLTRSSPYNENSFYLINSLSGHDHLFSNLHDMPILTQPMLDNGKYGNIQF